MRLDAGRFDRVLEEAIALQRRGVPLLDALRFCCHSAAGSGATADDVGALWDGSLDALALRLRFRDGLDVLMAVWEFESAAMERVH